MNRRIAFLLLFCVLLLAVFSRKGLNVVAGSKTIIVPTDFLTIQAAINNATDGDTIFVYNGTYYENVVVNKSVALVGQDEAVTIVDGGGVGTVIYVTANNVSITGFTIRNGGSSSPMSGISVSSNYANIRKNTVTNNYFGIYLANSRCNVVGNCSILDNQVGIYLESSVNNIMEHNNITDNHDTSVHLHYSSGNKVQGNNISGNGDYGIRLQYSDNNILNGNLVTGHENGIILDSSGNNTLKTNHMASNSYNFGVLATGLSDFIQDVDTSNTVNGKLVYYLVNQKDILINSSSNPNVGYLAFVNCTNVTAKDLNLTENGEGALFAYTTRSVIENSTIADNSRSILLYYSSYSNVSNNSIVNNKEGVILSSSSNSVMNDNVVADNNGSGVRLESSGNTTIMGNNITGNYQGGVYLYSSGSCKVNGNVVVNNSLGFRLQFSGDSQLTGNLIANNSGDGFYLSYSSNCTIQSNNVTSNFGYAFRLSSSDLNVVADNIIVDNHLHGVYFYGCDRNHVNRNVVARNQIGICVYYSTDTTLGHNNITDNFEEGIQLRYSPGSDISANMIVDNGGDGVYLFRSNQAKIVGNHMVNNSDGLHLFIAHNNTISGNELGENRNHGVYLSNSEDNNIFHNWLVENTRNVRVLESSGNMWDNGYPSGGNYWSDYAGIDEYTGPYQNLTGGDGLGDTPYIIDGVNQDRYPLMAPVRIHDIAVVDIGILSNEVYVGWMVEVDVSVENVGDYVESFSVTAYYNNTIIGTHTIRNLSVGANIIATFIWNTTSLPPCHNYILKAEATPVPDETNLEDNVYIWGHLKMKMVGDVNGDGKVDIRDITVVAMAFASHVGEPRYELKYDIKMDGVIDIRDITLAAMNFGLTCL